MTRISDLTFSYHCINDRAERINLIDNYIGWGQIIKERYYQQCYHCFTDTGIMLVLTQDKKKIITLYLVDEKEASIAFHGKIPKTLHRKISYHIAMGWVNLK